jgi:hypothetical protein
MMLVTAIAAQTRRRDERKDEREREEDGVG